MLFLVIPLFMFESPIQWIVVIAAITLLFGANKLPELAKSIGQARKEFKKGMIDAQDEPDQAKRVEPASIADLDDEALLQEIQRRKAKQLDGTSAD